MSETIQAIQTEYAGRRFRSRLEARYAVAFDILHLKWQYEVEGFDIGMGRGYLPDFRLAQYWAEVKPFAFTAIERCKAEKIVEHTRRPLLMLDGPLDFKSYEMLCWGEHDHVGHVFSEQVLIHPDWTGKSVWFQPSEGEIEMVRGCPRYSAAVAGARGARFEFGESGAAL